MFSSPFDTLPGAASPSSASINPEAGPAEKSDSGVAREKQTRVERIFLSMGSNLGRRRENLESALKRLSECGIRLRARSSVYETEPIGFREQPHFLNLACEIRTSLPPRELLLICQGIESEMGRYRRERNGPRQIDIDLLFYGKRIIQQDDFILPHPRLEARRFVLVPMDEIADSFVHPRLGLTIQQLLEACPDTSSVERI